MGRAHVALRMRVAGVGAPWRHPVDLRKWLRGPSGRQPARSWPRSSPAGACSTRHRAPCSPQRSLLPGQSAAGHQNLGGSTDGVKARSKKREGGKAQC